MAIKNSDLLDLNKPFDELLKDVQELTASFEKMGDVMANDLKKAAEDLAKTNDGKTTESFNKAAKALDDNNKKLAQNKTLQKELEKVKKQFAVEQAKSVALDKEETKELLKLKQANAQRKKDLVDEIKYGKIHNNSLKEKTKKLAELKNQYSRASAEVAKGMIPQIKKLDKEVKRLNSAIGNNQGRVGSYFSTFLKGAASMASMYLSFQGLTRLISNVTGIMIGFEKTMSGVKAISGATDAEMIKLSEDAKRLGSETNKTAVEVGNLQIAYAKLGFTTQEILDATEATVLLSQATGEDLASSAETAGATVRGFGLDATETGRIVDVMAASFTGSALNLERFRESMKYVAPVAKSVGLTVEQTTAYLSKLADAGIHGSQAGTALRMVMLKMAQAGLSGAEGFKEMASRAEGLAEANDEVGQRAATALLVMSEQSEELDVITEKYNNAAGAAKEMADTQMDNLAGSISILKSAWEGLVIRFTEGDGILRNVVDGLTSFVNILNRNASTIITVISWIGKLTAAWITWNLTLKLSKTGIISYIGNLFKLNTAQKVQIATTKLAKKAQVGLNTAMRNNPIGLVVSALMIAIPLLDSFSDSADDASESVDGIAEGIDKLTEEGKNRIKTSIELGKSELESVGEEIKHQEELLNSLTIANKKITNFTEEERKEHEKWIIQVTDGMTATYSVLTELRNKQKQIEADIAKKESEIRKKSLKDKKENDDKLIKLNLKKLEQEIALDKSILELQESTAYTMFEFEQKSARKILDYKRDNNLITETEYETHLNNLLIAQKEYQKDQDKIIQDGMYTLRNMEEPEEDEYYTTGEGVKSQKEWDDERASDAINTQGMTDVYSQFASGLTQIFDINSNKWADLISEFNTKISEQQSAVDEQLSRQSQGLADTYDTEKAKLVSLQAERDASLEKEKQNNINKLRLNQTEQISNIGLAVSKVYASDAKLGTLGVISAHIAIGSMLANIAATESQIQSLKKYEKGGLVDGPDHKEGGVKMIDKTGQVFAEMQGGEYVVNREDTKKSEKLLTMINKGELNDSALASSRDARAVRLLGIDDNTNAMKTLTDAFKSGTYINHNGKLITKRGNNIIRQ